MFNPHLLTLAGKDRTYGEEVLLSGAALRVDPGAGLPEVYIAFNDPSTQLIRVKAGEVLRTPFSRVFVFHAQLPDNVGPLELVAMDDCDGIEASGGEVLARPIYRYGQGLIAEALAPGLFKELHGLTTGAAQIAAPSAGRALTLLRYRLAVSANAALAVAGLLSITVQEWDGAAAGDVVHEHRWYVPAATIANALGALDTGWTELGPVGRSLAPGHVLRIVLGSTLTAGSVSAYIQAVDG